MDGVGEIDLEGEVRIFCASGDVEVDKLKIALDLINKEMDES